MRFRLDCTIAVRFPSVIVIAEMMPMIAGQGRSVIGVLNSAVSLFYYARIIKAMYLEEAIDERPLEVPAVYTGLLVALAVPILALGLYWTPLVRWAANAFGGGNIS